MPVEPARTKDRELLRRLIRDAFARQKSGHGSLTLRELFDTIRRCGTQLEGVGADKVYKVRREQLREELLAMKEVRAHDANTPRERFSLRS